MVLMGNVVGVEAWPDMLVAKSLFPLGSVRRACTYFVPVLLRLDWARERWLSWINGCTFVRITSLELPEQVGSRGMRA